MPNRGRITAMPKNVRHLINDFKPSTYQLALNVDKQALKISGTVKITGKVTKRPSNRIAFHQSDLKVTKAHITKIDKNGEQDIPVSRINNQNKLHEVRLHTKDTIYPGNYEINLTFTSKIYDDQMFGAYKSTVNSNGKESVLVATQFESHHARKCFPCIDEPAAKATFQLTISTDKNDTVLSNTNETKSSISGKTKTTVFEPTPIMSSYLLAFVIGDIHSVKATAKDDTTVRVWSSTARPKEMLNYALKEAVQVLDFFSDYYQTPYPLEKLDLVALPDFDAGAMENWGLTTYREILLLSDPKNRSISTEQYISLVIAHEIAHQWFGDLVTMQWWDDLWLNESFASIMEHMALDKIHPEWNQWELYASQDLLSTTNRDIYKDIQPVAVKVTDPEQIESLFDPGIVYAKGGRLLKMLHDLIGDEAFRGGLKLYFDKFAYKNATRDDLWNCLAESSKMDIAKFMDPWLLQPGMPILSIDQQGHQTVLTQSRYLIDEKVEDNTIWPIPLLANRPIDQKVLLKKSIKIHADSSLMFNPDGSAHYFVNYLDKAHFTNVAKNLHNNTIPASGRINTLNDIYMLARIGESSIVDALELVIANKPEKRAAVWTQMLRILNMCFLLTESDETVEQQLKQLKVSLAKPHLQELGWDDKPKDSSNDKQLRRTVMAMMISGEDKESIDNAKSIYRSAKNIDDINAEQRAVILSAMVRESEKDFSIRLLDKYSDSTPEIQNDICAALASTKDQEIANAVISKAFEKNIVKPQDVTRWIALFLRNHHIRDVMWNYVQNNWDWVLKTIGTGKSFDYLPIYFASTVSTDAGSKKFEKLFKKFEDNKILQKNIGISRVEIKSRIAWRKRDEAKIKDFLSIQK